MHLTYCKREKGVCSGLNFNGRGCVRFGKFYIANAQFHFFVLNMKYGRTLVMRLLQQSHHPGRMGL
ncbi:hypothetical protein DRE43_08415 [Salmonella enterica subsp. enterica serovar Java]|uniref:Uncharacterized protein n=4 Tax=Salmonella enterica TaxID=28901 RepID=A0A9Y2Y8W7_SALEB|nr:hypothetical protein [Salmonella enterica subsp. enterica serovar Java]EAN9725315.1 hypothetical protein [Salmonella enterica]EBU8673173.1 hypothetical protein [Salmonella enterica subsp. enterica serovar Panama]EBV8391696.1 hypothetical protein [Salmonella enterica subsp. enterica serovar Virchow]ECA3792291.1 hypothetical protein [Salmonella enterica subsp. enterica serovar Aqua]